ncbi:MAG TPA: hypothetical protein VMT67_17680 [Terriglobales bacterium]|nr:hypothetical protein [Terriglobales bacterium]
MDPLITNGVDPGLLRVIDKRGQERDREPRRKRVPASGTSVKEDEQGKQQGEETEAEVPKHELDDLA